MSGGGPSGSVEEIGISCDWSDISTDCGRGVPHVLQVSNPAFCDPHWGQVMGGLSAINAGVERVVSLR